MPRVSAETKQATRARLLEAAAEEFGRVGLARANVDAISLAAGYAKGTIYNYFPSKEDLFLAVVEEAVTQATAAGAAPTEAPAWDRLAATLAGFCAWAGEHDPFARVLVRECLMGTPGLYPLVIGAEAPLVDELATCSPEPSPDSPTSHWSSIGPPTTADRASRRSPSWCSRCCSARDLSLAESQL